MPLDICPTLCPRREPKVSQSLSLAETERHFSDRETTYHVHDRCD